MKVLTTKTLGISLMCGVLMAGCTKKEEPAPKKEEPQQATATTTKVAPKCDDVSVKNSLVKALSTATNDQIIALMDSYEGADKLDLARRTQQRLGEVRLDLKDIRVDGEACLAKMVATLPTSDINHAERYYKSASKPNLAELARTHSVELNNGHLSTSIPYTVQNGTANLSETPSALGFIANLMSASAYHMAKGEGRINTNARPAVTVQPLPPMEVTRPKPAVREPEIPNTPTPTPPTPSRTATPAPEPSILATEPDMVATPPTTSSVDTAPEPAQAVAPTPKPKATTTAPVEGDDEITIVESDETY